MHNGFPLLDGRRLWRDELAFVHSNLIISSIAAHCGWHMAALVQLKGDSEWMQY
jgi:hypothetical protein